MKNKLFKLEDDMYPEEQFIFLFKCPACLRMHSIGKNNPFNGNLVMPTFENEIKIQYYEDPKITECSSFITDGLIQYLIKSNHILSGKIVELPTWNSEWTDLTKVGML